MVAQKRNPTNADIYVEIKSIKSLQIDQAKDIEMLKNWKIAEDAAQAAIDKYKVSESQGDKRKLIRDVSAFLGVLVILIWAIIQYLSKLH